MNCYLIPSINGNSEFIETEQTEWSHKWSEDVMYYDIIGECKSLSRKQLERGLNLAFSTWEAEINIKLHPSRMHNKIPNFTIDFKTSDEEKQFKDSPSVLAYAYYPGQGSVSGKVVFNNDYIWSLDGKEVKAKDAIDRGYPVKGTPSPEQLLRTYKFITVAIHELGHSLGLKHDEHGDTVDAMDSHYKGMDVLSNWDILRIRLKYPERIFKHEGYQRFKTAILRAIRRSF